MGRYDEKEEFVWLEDMYMLRDMKSSTVTVRINRWHYHIPRVKLTMIEGYYKTGEEIDKALREAKNGQSSPILPEDYPKNFEIVCRPTDLLHLAETLAKVCDSNE